MLHDITATERAMRILLIVQAMQKRDPHFIIRDAVSAAMDEMSISRAAAYRFVRQAIDVLCIPYDYDEIRHKRTWQRVGDASSARMMQRKAA